MERLKHLELKYNVHFILTELQSVLPEGSGKFLRIQNMKELFQKTVLNKDPWNKEKLYLIFMLIHSFDTIKQHIIQYPGQNLKWKKLFTEYLPSKLEEHMNFKLNSAEFVCALLDLFFII